MTPDRKALVAKEIPKKLWLTEQSQEQQECQRMAPGPSK